MKGDIRLATLVRRIRDEFSGSPIVLRPHKSEGDPAITHFLHVLNVPIEQLHSTSKRAFELAFEVYGDDPLPLHITAIDPELTSLHFADSVGPMPVTLPVAEVRTSGFVRVSSGPFVTRAEDHRRRASRKVTSRRAKMMANGHLQLGEAIAAQVGVVQYPGVESGLLPTVHQVVAESRRNAPVSADAIARFAA